MPSETPNLDERLERHGISRRRFLAFCGAMAGALALPRATYASAVSAAFETRLAARQRPPLVWIEFQDCTGDTESFLRSNDPAIVDVLFDVISLNYHETLMVPAGADATRSLEDTLAQYPGQYICVVEGAIPMGAGGAYCLIGGRSALSIAQEVIAGAAVTIAAGACSVDGGLPGALPNPTGAVGVAQAVPGVRNLINLPGCPVNGVNLMAVLVYYLTNGSPPPLDSQRRPQSLYGRRIHQHCPRRENDEVRFYGDINHRNGGCLEELGCKGPITYANCYRKNWNGDTSWPIGAGALCIGCTNAHFWDTMTPFFAGGEVDD
ncbi:hydrogenase small subunit [Candidatus Chloroploca sp. Khr17]|uniref:hydrogenase small subunit n=1 Tax=Candidatus Chloroploca sp. Khr17 TaxID=2496869 RepID=UPI00101C4ED2|nr:hydrogenase small subunit [Candidatus Chloroploca sp. Khr17]